MSTYHDLPRDRKKRAKALRKLIAVVRPQYYFIIIPNNNTYHSFNNKRWNHIRILLLLYRSGLFQLFAVQETVQKHLVIYNIYKQNLPTLLFLNSRHRILLLQLILQKNVKVKCVIKFIALGLTIQVKLYRNKLRISINPCLQNISVSMGISFQQNISSRNRFIILFFY